MMIITIIIIIIIHYLSILSLIYEQQINKIIRINKYNIGRFHCAKNIVPLYRVPEQAALSHTEPATIGMSRNS